MKQLLVVDDEAAVIHVTKRMLEMRGYAVTGATTAAEGLRLFEGQEWDLVIVDRAMPVMDGEELVEQIRQRAPQIPILLITGFPESVRHPERVAAVVTKPFASAQLLTQINRLLEEPGH
jgi:CheY-like chemotaxis protein